MANEDKRIIELPASESILNDDWIGKDSASEGTTKMQLSFLKQLFGGNNFAGEWQSGTTFARDSYVVHEGKLYHNISGGGITQLSWSASPWQEITVSEEIKKLATNLANTFNKNTSYGSGDYVVYNNVLFKCVAAHSGVWNPVHFTEVNATDLINDVVIQLSNAIASEASARSNADSTLQSNIDNLSNETIHIDSDGKFFVYVEE